MADLFVTIVAATPLSAESSAGHNGIPGLSPGVKNGITANRGNAPTSFPSSLLTGLVGYWTFDGNSLATFGPSNGTDVGPVSYGAGKINQGVIQAAGSPRIDIPSLSLGSTYTYAGWIKPDAAANSAGHAGVIYGIEGAGPASSGLYVHWDGASTHTVTWFHNTNTGLFDTVIPTSQFTHVAVALSATGFIKIYINGVRSATPDFNLGAVALSLTKFGTGDLAGSYKGAYDEFGAWNRELLPFEVLSLYHGGAGQQYPFPV